MYIRMRIQIIVYGIYVYVCVYVSVSVYVYVYNVYDARSVPSICLGSLAFELAERRGQGREAVQDPMKSRQSQSENFRRLQVCR